MTRAKELTLGASVGAAVAALREAKGLGREAFARLARENGWAGCDAPALARLEAGDRGISLEAMVPLALTLDVPLAELVGGDDGDFVVMGEARVSVAALRALLVGAAPGPLPTADVRTPGMEALWRRLGRRREGIRRMSQIWPRATTVQLEAASRAAAGTAERKAARRLGVDAAILSAAAFRRWGCSFTDERDRRVSASETSARSLQALRGHVTRQLLAELAPILEEARK